MDVSVKLPLHEIVHKHSSVYYCGHFRKNSQFQLANNINNISMHLKSLKFKNLFQN